MSTVAAGPLFVLAGPAPEAPPNSLLNTPGVMQEGAPVVGENGEPRWPAGATIFGHPASVPSIWAECFDGTDDVKDQDSEIPEGAFRSFSIYIPVGCSFRGRFSVDELQQKAEDVLMATRSHAVERVLAHGHWMVNQPKLMDGTDLSPGSPVSPGIGISILDQAIGLTGRKGMIHATPASVDALGAIPLGGDDDSLELVTLNGTPIVAGTGYIDPEKELGEVASDTIDWMFATGPVEAYVREEIFVPDLEEALDRSMNDWVMRPETEAFVYWDTALNVRVQVDWSL